MIYDLPLRESAQPENWIAQPLRKLADVIGGGTPETEVPEYWHPAQIPWVTPTDISACRERVLTRTERAISELGLRESSATLLPIGTTLLTSRATVGECRLAGVPVATNQGFASLVPKEAIDHEFLFYLAQTLKPVLVRLAAGTTFIEISRRELRRVNVCIPAEPKEREMIGRILSSADEALAAKAAQLKASRRLKTALMQQLFTRGVPGLHNQFRKTKWCEAPSCWKFRQLRQVAAVQSGFTMGRDLLGYETVEVAYLTVINVQEGSFDLSDVQRVQVKASEVEDLMLRSGDVLMTEGGDRDKLGRGGLWDGQINPCVYQNHIFRIRFEPNTYKPELFHFLLQTWHAKNYFYAHAKQTSNLCTINSRELKRFPFFEPPPDEQEEMVSLLQSANSEISAIESEIVSLDRVKRSLLQNLLTGHIRVKV